ncbi:MAG: 4-hydroxy-tetrahydrodipicolinate reductase [Lentisphaerae bacterium]|jgi:4-hydroxy-tetrahydrodipicolinate reductase|nr:4-hydroxy-tetrahydrodipicolinate reductase [Lentisphaerota bacterium]MBT4822547.1 4-hydroxy-tetrahydrodipicolinate reductase [Lentisphaerota bacterium]MBT5604690.1 4-hydroxy-tetrahydrodipicolinate reductase [Lentisphaerota bacterium]MBT7053810.1 4-hydroxy-tetrahydrodipicolinate reductase [Lentisphaerota bacterium]MBT7847189.1 4-hydroxy-tetrahydrodipicolinate reductase [Lentisphaerota bacterium]
MTRILILGAAGRMGRMLIAHVLRAPDMDLAGATEAPGNPALGQDAGVLAGQDACGVAVTDDAAALLDGADAVIDFTAPSCTMALAPVAAARGCALVIGTTGLTQDDKNGLASLAEDGARIVFAPNMSIGVNLLFYLCGKVTPILGDDYDIEVVEMHHNQKKDAPSGTAARLGEILADAAGLDYEEDTCHGREGMVGARPKKQIGMHAVRGGDVVGDHTVIFATQGERVELTHKAGSRETFTKGALRAVRFLAQSTPGLYDMQDVLGLRD